MNIPKPEGGVLNWNYVIMWRIPGTLELSARCLFKIAIYGISLAYIDSSQPPSIVTITHTSFHPPSMLHYVNSYGARFANFPCDDKTTIARGAPINNGIALPAITRVRVVTLLVIANRMESQWLGMRLQNYIQSINTQLSTRLLWPDTMLDKIGHATESAHHWASSTSWKTNARSLVWVIRRKRRLH